VGVAPLDDLPGVGERAGEVDEADVPAVADPAVFEVLDAAVRQRAGEAPPDDAVAKWCERWLGAAPVREIFRSGHLPVVRGLELSDGHSADPLAASPLAASPLTVCPRTAADRD
jgi:hypothetical protein